MFPHMTRSNCFLLGRGQSLAFKVRWDALCLWASQTTIFQIDVIASQFLKITEIFVAAAWAWSSHLTLIKRGAQPSATPKFMWFK